MLYVLYYNSKYHLKLKKINNIYRWVEYFSIPGNTSYFVLNGKYFRNLEIINLNMSYKF